MRKLMIIAIALLGTSFAQAQEWSAAVNHSGGWYIKKQSTDPFSEDEHPSSMLWVNGRSLTEGIDGPDLQFRLGDEDNNFKIQIDQPGKNPYSGTKGKYVTGVKIDFIFNGDKSTLLSLEGQHLKYKSGEGNTLWEVYDGVKKRLAVAKRCQQYNFVHVKVSWLGADNTTRYHEVFKFSLTGFTTTMNSALKHSDLALSAANANKSNENDDNPFKG